MTDWKIAWCIVLLFGKVHTWIMSENWFFGEFLFFQQQWERVFSWVLESQLFYFYCTVSKEEVQLEMIDTTFQSIIRPENFEWQNFSIILQILSKTIIWMTSSQSDFNVFFVFFSVWRIDFYVFSLSESIEQVFGFLFRLI